MIFQKIFFQKQSLFSILLSKKHQLTFTMFLNFKYQIKRTVKVDKDLLSRKIIWKSLNWRYKTTPTFWQKCILFSLTFKTRSLKFLILTNITNLSIFKQQLNDMQIDQKQKKNFAWLTIILLSKNSNEMMS